MGANKGSNESVSYFKLIAKAEKANTEEKMAIVQVAKNAKGDYVQTDWFRSLSGFITKLEIKEFEFEGATKEKFIMHIEDADGICQLEFTNNMATQGLINGMLNADLTKEVEVSAWISKKGYVGAGIKYKNATENIDWAIALDDQPKPVPYKTPSGKEEKDNTNVLSFWRNKFIDLAKKAVKSNFAGERKQAEEKEKFAGYEQKEAPKQQSSNTQSSVNQADESDLPFVILLLVSLTAFFPF
jgi:hypothetical protein